MHIKAIVSAAALSAARGFGGVVFAQDAAATTLPTMIGEQQLSEADAQRVKVYCEDLQTASEQSDTSSSTEGDAEDAPDNEAEDSTAAVGSVDMDSITLELCVESGFIEAAAQ